MNYLKPKECSVSQYVNGAAGEGNIADMLGGHLDDIMNGIKNDADCFLLMRHLIASMIMLPYIIFYSKQVTNVFPDVFAIFLRDLYIRFKI